MVNSDGCYRCNRLESQAGAWRLRKKFPKKGIEAGVIEEQL